MKKYDIVTFGSATIDTFLETAQERTTQTCTDGHCENFLMFPSGAKLLVEEAHRTIGGGGTNVAFATSRLGLSTAYGGCLGNDPVGDEVLAWLAREGIDFVGSRVDAETNFSVILDSKLLHDRVILAYRDSSDLLHIGDLDLDEFSATWFYFSSLMGDSFSTMIDLMKHAQYSGVAVAYNPSEYQVLQGLDSLREALQLSQLVVMNRREAEILLDMKASRADLCRALREVGAEIVLITEGSHGASLLYADQIYHGPSQAENIVETTGAGDCFASSFLAGLDLSLSPQDALRLAFVNVESLLTQVGPKQGLLDQESAQARLSSDTRKISQENA